VHVPDIELNNGVLMPQLGFGVFQVPDDDAESAVRIALESGYRSIDTASLYGNEAGVGRAIASSGLSREELFVTTKLWNTDQGYERAFDAYTACLDRLELDYVDLYLIHWPKPTPRQVRRDLEIAGEAVQRRPGARHRGVELPARAPATAARRDRHRAGGQSDRAASLLPAA
jgi:2,5-diketo-D-gluconate reductase A